MQNNNNNILVISLTQDEKSDIETDCLSESVRSRKHLNFNSCAPISHKEAL